MKRCKLAFAMAFLTTACVHTYEVPDPIRPLNIRSEPSFYVARAKDGRDARPQTYLLSGQWTTDAVVAALENHGGRTVSGEGVENLDRNLEAARGAKSNYLVVAEILNWEDRVTEWSGIPDRLAIRMIVTNVESGNVVDDRTLYAKSRWFTWGGDHPQDLLPALMERWAEQLF